MLFILFVLGMLAILTSGVIATACWIAFYAVLAWIGVSLAVHAVLHLYYLARHEPFLKLEDMPRVDIIHFDDVPSGQLLKA